MLTLATRFMWMRLYIEVMQALIPPMSDEYDDLVDAPNFKYVSPLFPYEFVILDLISGWQKSSAPS